MGAVGRITDDWHYEDHNFISRVANAPALAAGDYPDKPAARLDDWGGQVRTTDIRLAAAVDEDSALAGEEGGLQKQRHPGVPEEGVTKPAAPEHETDLGLAEGESDAAADERTMDRLRALGSLARAHAMNEGASSGDDLLPSF